MTPSALSTALLVWFDRDKRDLPWRRTKDPYAIWISEVMLQQTQVVTVIPYWKRFLERFPDVRSLADSELPEVFSCWSGLGYYSRARNLHRAAQVMVSAHAGAVPSTRDELLELPGFGPYTAGAVASIAFGRRAPIVDGNVARVFSRLFVVEGAPGEREREKRLWSIATRLVAESDRPGDWNQALMELGATVCRVEAPSCLLCPVRSHCGALRSGRVAQLPPARVRAAKQRLRLAAGVWRRGDEILLARRAEGGLFGGLWELPSVEIDSDADATSVHRAMAALFGRVKVGAPLGSVKRVLTHRALTVELFEVEGRRVPKPGLAMQEWRWATAKDARGLGMSTAMSKALALALDGGPPPQKPAEVSGRRRGGRRLS